jgi:hypothetical protein
MDKYSRYSAVTSGSVSSWLLLAPATHRRIAAALLCELRSQRAAYGKHFGTFGHALDKV